MNNFIETTKNELSSGEAATQEMDELQSDMQRLRAEADHLRIEADSLRTELNKFQMGWPPGHFYSPIPSLEEVKLKEDTIFHIPQQIPGVDLNIKMQLDLLNEFSKYYIQQPFPNHKQTSLRYFFENPNFRYGEAIALYCMIMHLRPRRIIEIGSGYSSCVTLDTNELFFRNSIRCTFIEPYPQLLYSLIKESDKENIDILQYNLQDIDSNIFSSLSSGDILFIDSTHVSKIHSDVNHIFFKILPCLEKGVYVHFHDIYYPFEYPKEWIYQGRAWNEAYTLRAFLQYNNEFKIQFFNSFLSYFHMDLLAQKMPLIAYNPGSSIWLKKL